MSDQNEPQEDADQNDGGPAEAATKGATKAATMEPGATEQNGPRDVLFSEVESSKGSANAVPIDPTLDRVYDLTVPVTVEVGHTNLSVQEILQLAPGSVVELDHAADAPVELLVHGKCVAKGEIVVVDDFYGVRITSIGDS